jgi:NTP pyrophosphatase (non-canonical NTP hydrolase)
MKFTKKPVTIEAVQFNPPKEFSNRFAAHGTFFSVHLDARGVHANISTLEGDHRADPGDWIIKGVKGEFYPCKPDIFEMTYTAAGAAQPLTLQSLRDANAARHVEWWGGNPQAVTLSFRGNELAGEVGEACNVIKKLERERLGIAGSRATDEQLGDELADVVICADLAAMDRGIDLAAAVARKFNATSEKVGMKTRLPFVALMLAVLFGAFLVHPARAQKALPDSEIPDSLAREWGFIESTGTGHAFTLQPSSIVITGNGPEPLLTIKPNGEVIAKDSLTATEAGRVFVKYLRDNYNPCGTR